METQTWLSCHYKFIPAENIIILSVSLNNFLHAFLEVAEWQLNQVWVSIRLHYIRSEREFCYNPAKE